MCKTEQRDGIEGKKGIESEYRIIPVKACAHSDYQYIREQGGVYEYRLTS